MTAADGMVATTLTHGRMVPGEAGWICMMAGSPKKQDSLFVHRYVKETVCIAEQGALRCVEFANNNRHAGINRTNNNGSDSNNNAINRGNDSNRSSGAMTSAMTTVVAMPVTSMRITARICSMCTGTKKRKLETAS